MAKISEVLHLAADKYLADGPKNKTDSKEWYSCCAVIAACTELKVSAGVVLDGLASMGVRTGSTCEMHGVEDPQGARYMWLKFAALMAEEQGV